MNNIESSKGEIVMYQPDETIRLEVRMDEETVWLSANQMADLFDRDEKTIRKLSTMCFQKMRYLRISIRIFCVLIIQSTYLHKQKQQVIHYHLTSCCFVFPLL